MTLQELTEKLAALSAERKLREANVGKMKDLEKKLKGMIRSSLIAGGMKTANIDGVGMVTVTTQDHAEISDKSQLANFILNYANNAKTNGTDPVDAIAVLQARAAIGNIKELMELGFTPEEMGVRIVEKPGLTFKPTK